METDRMKFYEELGKSAGNTPLIKFSGEVPNGNSIYIKRECDNPFGSHYDRVYLALFRHYECTGNIKPGDKVLETTSGAAGVSFAGIGRLLGYDCSVVLPAGGEKAREAAIRMQLPAENRLILTPAEDYVSGFPNFLKEFLARNKDYFFLNHSMGLRDKQTGKYANNEITLKALETIAEEVVKGVEVDYFLPAVGNGSSVLGPGRAFRRMNPLTRVIAFESVQSAVAFGKLHPGEYYNSYEITPGTLSRHRLPGTSYQGIDFPHIRDSIEGGIIDDVVLVSDAKIDAEYHALTGRTDTTRLPHWDVCFAGHADLGRSTRAGISVALHVSKQVSGKNILVIGYDKAERYDY